MDSTRELNLRELGEDADAQLIALENALETDAGCSAALWTRDFGASGKLGKGTVSATN